MSRQAERALSGENPLKLAQGVLGGALAERIPSNVDPRSRALAEKLLRDVDAYPEAAFPPELVQTVSLEEERPFLEGYIMCFLIFGCICERERAGRAAKSGKGPRRVGPDPRRRLVNCGWRARRQAGAHVVLRGFDASDDTGASPAGLRVDGVGVVPPSRRRRSRRGSHDAVDAAWRETRAILDAIDQWGRRKPSRGSHDAVDADSRTATQATTSSSSSAYCARGPCRFPWIHKRFPRSWDAVDRYISDENVPDVVAHAGFLFLAEALLDDLAPYLDIAPEHNLIFTGHSIGGALAGLCTVLARTRDDDRILSKPSAIVFAPLPCLKSQKDTVLSALDLDETVVRSFVQPWDPLVRWFTEHDPLLSVGRGFFG